MKVVPVVAGCIIENKRILIGLRKASSSPETINMWEMLGGRVEEGETFEEALAREFKEELGMVIYVKELLHAQINTYSEGTSYLVLFFLCDRLSAKGKGENIKTKWAYPNSLEFKNTLPGAKEALSKLIERGKY